MADKEDITGQDTQSATQAQGNDRKPRLSQADLDRMMLEDFKIRNSLPKTVVVEGRTYKVRRIGSTVRMRIENLALTSYYLQQQAQKEITLRKAKRLNKKLRNTHAKIAAYYVLGQWALFVPFLWRIKWRFLALRTSETLNAINNIGVNDPDTFFYLANSNIIKDLLALSMRTVGEEVTKYGSRKESAENMVKEDASMKEDSKSGVSSRRRR